MLAKSVQHMVGYILVPNANPTSRTQSASVYFIPRSINALTAVLLMKKLISVDQTAKFATKTTALFVNHPRVRAIK